MQSLFTLIIGASQWSFLGSYLGQSSISCLGEYGYWLKGKNLAIWEEKAWKHTDGEKTSEKREDGFLKCN